MRVAILDTNVLRGLKPAEFAAVREAEAAAGIRAYGDIWTLMELLSHLESPKDPSYRASRVAVRRYAERALEPPNKPPRVIAPSELQMTRIVFGDTNPADQMNIEAHIELARKVVSAEDDDDLSAISADITVIAEHVRIKEQWFANYFSQLREQLIEAATGKTNSEINAAIREYTRSADAHRQDAIAQVYRAFDQRGVQRPSELAAELIDKAAAAARASIFAVEVLLERILCDHANLSASRIRNLLWDQEVACTAGQTISGLPVVLVTNDGFFREAGTRGGFADAIQTPAEYAELLGITLTQA